MELILYYIKESRTLLISFLILMFVLGIFAYIAIKNFKQDKKMKVFFYGLFLNMENIDILKMSSIIVKTFLVFYATLITKELMIYLSLAMIVMVTCIYIICSFKRIIYEIICTAVQIFMIYFIYVIDGYMTAVEYTTVILVIRTILMALLLIFTTYMLFRNIDLIAEDRVDKNIKKTEKQKDSAKGMN